VEGDVTTAIGLDHARAEPEFVNGFCIDEKMFPPRAPTQRVRRRVLDEKEDIGHASFLPGDDETSLEREDVLVVPAAEID
jgi:hypothetical protein